MRRLISLALALATLIASGAVAQSAPGGRVVNPDEITVYFPAFDGDGMLGGIVQTMRGDWAGAARNLERVVDNPATRMPLRLDALLLLGMAQTRGGGSGRATFDRALEQAPYDHRVVRYAVMDRLARGGAENGASAMKLLTDKRRLFDSDDMWLATALETAQVVREQ